MTTELYIEWKVRATLPIGAPDYRGKSRLFGVQTGKSFIHSIGGNLKSSLQPSVLVPTSIFYDLICSDATRLGFRGKKLPFELHLAEAANDVRVNLVLHLYGSRLLMLTVRLEPFNLNIDSPDLASLRDLKNHASLLGLTKAVLRLMVGGGHPTSVEASEPKLFPCSATLSGSSQVPDDIAVSILARHKAVNRSVVEAVLKKNQIHQVDSNSLLIDRQGILFRVDTNSDIRESLRRFRRACNAFELVVAIESLIRDRELNSLTDEQRSSVEELILRPDSMLAFSTTARYTWKLLLAEFSVPEVFATESARRALGKPSRLERYSWLFGIVAAVVAILGFAWAIWIYFVPNDSGVAKDQGRQATQGSGNTVIQGPNNTIVTPPQTANPSQLVTKGARQEGNNADGKVAP